MFRTTAARALIAAAALAAVGGGTALAATPSATSQNAAAGAHARHRDADVRHGVITAVSDSSMTIEHSARDKATKEVKKDDLTFKITPQTLVYHAGSKDQVGHDALKVGERVRVRFAETSGQKTATRIVIERDVRAGKVVSKGDHSFVVHTAKRGDVTVTVTDDTKYTTGRKKDRRAGSFADLKVGDRVTALGEEDSKQNFDAVAVRYNAPAEHRGSAPAAH
ncbi:MAG: DUF5666 domain-containing protein [Candidatus Dormibacteria bacterium]